MALGLLKKITHWLGQDGWRQLYVYRRLTPSELNSRNIVTIAFAGALLSFLMAALTVKAMRPVNWSQLVKGRDGIRVMTANDVRMVGVAPHLVHCDTDCDALGIPDIKPSGHPILSPAALNDLAISRQVLPTASKSRYWAQIVYDVDPSVLGSLILGREQVIIGLHRLSYRLAQVHIDGRPWGTFANSAPLRLTIPAGYVSAKTLSIKVTYSLHDNGVTYLERGDLIPPFVASQEEVRRVQQFELSFRDNNGAIVGLMSRILIGVFALMLFLFMDSAPETLGLALLLGSEALALGLSQGWIATPINPFLIHFCSQMGDVFRLYFFLQLSRVTKPHTTRWVMIGVLLSIPWGVLKQMEVRWGIDGLAVVPRIRDLTVGTIGAMACLRTLWSIRGMGLPWRRVALLLGAVGSIQQVLGPLTHYWPQWNESDGFRGFYVVYEAMSVYIMALSTFTNISTLENRVRSLSAAKARSDMMEQELELGRAVQRAFLNIPPLPTDFDVQGRHEAAVYVSGDIHFVHWDDAEQRFVLILADVTGHGVQAALKATACYMVARNLWQTKSRAAELVDGSTSVKSMNPGARLAAYHQQSTELLSLLSAAPEISAFGGLELYPALGRAYFYRHNFHTPMVIMPTDAGQWVITTPQLPVGEIVEVAIRPGTVVAMFSDGYVEGSRQMASLLRFVTERLSSYDGSADGLRTIFASFDQQNQHRPDDDRTLIVMSWQRDKAAVHPAVHRADRQAS
jgi:hypothetical protein